MTDRTLQEYGRVNRYERKIISLDLSTEEQKAIAAKSSVLRNLDASRKDSALVENVIKNRSGLLAALTPEVREKMGIKQDFKCNDDYTIENLILARIPLLSMSEQKEFFESAEKILQIQSQDCNELKI